jgi:AcrR family transcriptional regulator
VVGRRYTVHRALIREQALALFSHISFAKTSVADIAKACGLGKGTIYLYYKSKDDIVLSIIDEHISKVVEESDPYFHDEAVALRDKIERFFRELVGESFALKKLIFGDFENVKGSVLKDVFFKYGRYYEQGVDRLTGIVASHDPYSARPVEALREDIRLLIELMVGRIALFLVARDWNDEEGLRNLVGPLSLRLFDAIVEPGA